MTSKIKLGVLSLSLLFLAGCSSVSLDDGNKAGSLYGDQQATQTAGGGKTPVTVEAQENQNLQRGASFYFGFDKYDVNPQDTPLLMKYAQFLRTQPNLKVKLEGNTDERGGSEYNLALGQKRSEAVLQRLLFLGVPSEQMEAVSFGKEKPKALGHNEEAWAVNRRVDLVFPSLPKSNDPIQATPPVINSEPTLVQ